MCVKRNKEKIQINKESIDYLKKMTKKLEEKTNGVDSNLLNNKNEAN